ncbi:hypothetical protein [Janibacter melonis]|uniref:hypothetical protein n=1 Tax=Janibacter melonis TaxID=262209 RepID=UPI0020956BD9|nr:hypothetical protein [Janibacter melonis]
MTVVFVAGLALLVPVVGIAGLLTAMSSDGCTASKGNDALLGLGAPGSAAAFAAMATAALVRVVMRQRSDRSTWWVPLVAVGAGAVLWSSGR